MRRFDVSISNWGGDLTAPASMCGRSDGPQRLVSRHHVERGKIRKFAVATHSSNPEYLEREDAVSLPTFFTRINAWAPPDGNPWKAVEFDENRGLYAEQQYEFLGPPPTAGTRLRCTS